MATAAEKEARWQDDQRIARQRNLFTFLPPGPSVEALKQGMLQRAYDLLTDGNAEACDAITEFLPSRDVEKMLDEWMNDQDPATTAFSAWHERK